MATRTKPWNTDGRVRSWDSNFAPKRDYAKEARQASRLCHLDPDLCMSLLKDGWWLVVDPSGYSWDKGAANYV